MLAGADREDRVRDCGIIGHAALELRRSSRLLDLADEIDVGGGMITVLGRHRRWLNRNIRYHANEQRFAGAYSKKLAYRCSHGAGRAGRSRQADGCLRATHGNDVTDRLVAARRQGMILLAQPLSVQHVALAKPGNVRPRKDFTDQELGLAKANWLMCGYCKCATSHAIAVETCEIITPPGRSACVSISLDRDAPVHIVLAKQPQADARTIPQWRYRSRAPASPLRARRRLHQMPRSTPSRPTLCRMATCGLSL